jgi:hypothetical protein
VKGRTSTSLDPLDSPSVTQVCDASADSATVFFGNTFDSNGLIVYQERQQSVKNTMNEPRDGWSKAEIICTALGAIVLPAALFVVGNRLTTQQESAAEAGRQAERLTALLQPLASENPRERRLAIEVIGYLGQNRQLPMELLQVLLNIARTEPDSGVAQDVSQALARVEQGNPSLAPLIQKDLKSLQARLYFHIDTESQRAAAQTLATQIASVQGLDLVVPGIERVAWRNRSELRFFKKTDQQEAARIVQDLRRFGAAVSVRDLSARYEGSDRIRPRHFELWLGDDFPEGSSSDPRTGRPRPQAPGP